MNYLQYKLLKKNNFLQILQSINWNIIFILFAFFFTGCAVLYSASGGEFSPLVKNHIL